MGAPFASKSPSALTQRAGWKRVFERWITYNLQILEFICTRFIFSFFVKHPPVMRQGSSKNSIPSGQDYIEDVVCVDSIEIVY